jgi:hypothetical protein
MPTSSHQHLIAELEAAHRCGAPLVLDHASPFEWTAACHELLENCADRIDFFDYAARRLHAAYPDVTYLATMVAWLDAMPRQSPAPLAFRDDPPAEIQIVRRPDCDAVLLCFCGIGENLGVPLNFAHQWLGRLPASVVYIKDFLNLYGGCGYPSLGSDQASSVAALRRLVEDLGGKRIYTLGVSMGGYPALHYGLQLGAVRTLSLAGTTDLTPYFAERLGPFLPHYPSLIARAPEYAKDLSECYASAQRRPPHVLLAFNAGNSRDRQHAERMLKVRNVELLAVEGNSQHNVVDPLMRRGEYWPLLQRLLA